jgi:hypothetical protein
MSRWAVCQDADLDGSFDRSFKASENMRSGRCTCARLPPAHQETNANGNKEDEEEEDKDKNKDKDKDRDKNKDKDKDKEEAAAFTLETKNQSVSSFLHKIFSSSMIFFFL